MSSSTFCTIYISLHCIFSEFEALARLGIPDPVNYIKKRFKSSKLLFLKSACVGQALVDQLEASVEEAVNSSTWTDLQPMIPSSLMDEDVGILISQVMRTTKVQSSARVLSATVVVSEKFISNCLSLFDEAMQQKAQKEVKSNPVFLITEEDLKQPSVLAENTATSRKDKRDERRKKASEGSGSVKGGGGGNAREIRIRKTKKKGMRKDEDSDDETGPTTQNSNRQAEIPFLSVDEIVGVLEEKVCDCSEDMLLDLAEHLLRPLTKAYQEVVRTTFVSSSSSSSGGSRKQNMKDLQEEVSNLYTNIKLFDKGSKVFSDDTQANIAKHVLKTVCSDVTNILINFVASDGLITSDSSGAITNEVRLKILAKLPDETKGPLTKLHSSLNGKSIEDFITNLEVAAEECGFMLKRGDKKRERQALFQHRQALLEQLKLTEDHALVLHLASVLLFQASTHCMLHAPGRCVPQIIGTLLGKIPEDQHKLLSRYQTLVVKQLVSQSQSQGQSRRAEQDGGDGDGDGDAEDAEAIHKELLSLTPQVKDLILAQKKNSVTEE